jgi:hypothetical protein
MIYCEAHRGDLQASGLPAELFRRESVLEEFLEYGRFCDALGEETTFAEMTDQSFLALEQFVNGFFDFQDGYPAWQNERFRRFQRYG